MFRYLFVCVVLLLGFTTQSLAQEVDCPEGYVCTRSDTDSTVTTNGNMTTRIEQPPPSAISPQFSAGNNNDLCTIGVAGAVQTQILGISAGGTFTEENCQRLKNAKTLYDMGMKVAAVSVMCQDERVFRAMMDAGTPCPFDGLIGQQAKDAWNSPDNKHLRPDAIENKKVMDDDTKSTLMGGGVVGGLLLLLLL